MAEKKPATPTPKDWPADADKTLAQRTKYMNGIDFLKLQKDDTKVYAASFIIIQPILLQFRGLQSSKQNLKFAIIGSSTTLNMINYYAPKIGKNEPLSTFDEDQYLEHVYIKLTEKLGEKDRKRISDEYEKYKNNPKEAMLCVIRQNDEDRLIPLSQLINEDVKAKLQKNAPNKDMIVSKRKEMAESAVENDSEEQSDRKGSDKKQTDTKENKSPSKSESDKKEHDESKSDSDKKESDRKDIDKKETDKKENKKEKSKANDSDEEDTRKKKNDRRNEDRKKESDKKESGKSEKDSKPKKKNDKKDTDNRSDSEDEEENDSKKSNKSKKRKETDFESSDKKENKSPAKKTTKKKQKTEEDDSKSNINVDSVDHSLADKLSHVLLSGFAQVMGYPDTTDNHAIMAKVIFETAAILTEKGK